MNYPLNYEIISSQGRPAVASGRSMNAPTYKKDLSTNYGKQVFFV